VKALTLVPVLGKDVEGLHVELKEGVVGKGPVRQSEAEK